MNQETYDREECLMAELKIKRLETEREELTASRDALERECERLRGENEAVSSELQSSLPKSAIYWRRQGQDESLLPCERYLAYEQAINHIENALHARVEDTEQQCEIIKAARTLVSRYDRGRPLSGVIEALRLLLKDAGYDPQEVAYVLPASDDPAIIASATAQGEVKK